MESFEGKIENIPQNLNKKTKMEIKVGRPLVWKLKYLNNKKSRIKKVEEGNNFKNYQDLKNIFLYIKRAP